MSKVILQCVRQGPRSERLRIRFIRFTDENGNHSTNVYRNDINCRFPKQGRMLGHYYEVPHEDVSLVFRGASLSHYSIKGSRIKNLGTSLPETQQSDKSELKEIYTASECVICLEDSPNTTFGPCGHSCMCRTCLEQMQKMKQRRIQCPLCRRTIENTFFD